MTSEIDSTTTIGSTPIICGRRIDAKEEMFYKLVKLEDKFRRLLNATSKVDGRRKAVDFEYSIFLYYSFGVLKKKYFFAVKTTASKSLSTVILFIFEITSDAAKRRSSIDLTSIVPFSE
jgi:hypothetical protein